MLGEYAEQKIAVLIARLAKTCAIKLRLGTDVDMILGWWNMKTMAHAWSG